MFSARRNLTHAFNRQPCYFLPHVLRGGFSSSLKSHASREYKQENDENEEDILSYKPNVTTISTFLGQYKCIEIPKDLLQPNYRDFHRQSMSSKIKGTLSAIFTPPAIYLTTLVCHESVTVFGTMLLSSCMGVSRIAQSVDKIKEIKKKTIDQASHDLVGPSRCKETNQQAKKILSRGDIRNASYTRHGLTLSSFSFNLFSHTKESHIKRELKNNNAQSTHHLLRKR